MDSKHPLEADILSGLEAITFLENNQSVIFKNFQETTYFQEAITQAKCFLKVDYPIHHKRKNP
jgi:hypothetical protein